MLDPHNFLKISVLSFLFEHNQTIVKEMIWLCGMKKNKKELRINI